LSVFGPGIWGPVSAYYGVFRSPPAVFFQSFSDCFTAVLSLIFFLMGTISAGEASLSVSPPDFFPRVYRPFSRIFLVAIFLVLPVCSVSWWNRILLFRFCRHGFDSAYTIPGTLKRNLAGHVILVGIAVTPCRSSVAGLWSVHVSGGNCVLGHTYFSFFTSTPVFFVRIPPQLRPQLIFPGNKLNQRFQLDPSTDAVFLTPQNHLPFSISWRS